MYIVRIEDIEGTEYYIAKNYEEAEIYLSQCGYKYTAGSERSGLTYWSLDSGVMATIIRPYSVIDGS
jgi:hypothetical protein